MRRRNSRVERISWGFVFICCVRRFNLFIFKWGGGRFMVYGREIFFLRNFLLIYSKVLMMKISDVRFNFFK